MYQHPRRMLAGNSAAVNASYSTATDPDLLVAFERRDAALANSLSVARQRQAEHVKSLALLAGRNVRTIARWAVTGSAVIAASVLLLQSYATLLTWQHVPASAPALIAVLAAATLSSIAGFAFAGICGAILLQLMNDPVEVVEIMMVCSIAIQSLSVAVLWRDIDWRMLPRFVAGGMIGLPVGVWLLLHLGHTGVRDAIGGLLIAYAAYRVFKRPTTVIAASGMADAGMGFLGGITGGLAGFPGAAVTIWCSLRGWDKHRQRGIYQPFILIMQVAALLLIQAMRPSVISGVHLTTLEFVPVALLGTWFGLAIFRRLPDRSFATAVNLLLLVSGAGLLA